jgi:hypothetical protein
VFLENNGFNLGTIYFKKMDLALFANARRDLDLQPYHYNMVKGLDFTNWDLIC